MSPRRWLPALLAALGPQGWWPATTPFEVCVGAILTQNTAWGNVERAIRSLKEARCCSVAGVRRCPETRLARLIRSAGTYRQKARTLKAFVAYLDARHGGSVRRLARADAARVRAELLAVRGIGPETADSILLYVGAVPVFIADAYARRIGERHRLFPPGTAYGAAQRGYAARLGDQSAGAVVVEVDGVVVADSTGEGGDRAGGDLEGLGDGVVAQ